MLIAKRKSFVRNIVTAAVLVGLVLSGCSDNPEDKAAKEIREGTQKAVDVIESNGDLQEAEKYIKDALRKAGRAGASAEPAYLASGNLAVARAQTLHMALSSHAEPVSKVIDRISKYMHKLNNLSVQADLLDSFFAATNTEVEEFDKVLTGDAEQTGLKAKLMTVDTNLQQLRQEKEQLENKLEQKSAEAGGIQKQADEQLLKAQATIGDEKLKFQKQGYDLLLSKNSFYEIIQATADEIELIDSQITIVNLVKQKLQEYIKIVEGKISDIENSTGGADFKAMLSDIQKQIDDHNSLITRAAGDLKTKHSQYGTKAEEIVTLFEQAAEDYEKIRTRGMLSEMADFRRGGCFFNIASTSVDSMKFQQHTASRLQSVLAASEDPIADSLSQIVVECTQLASDHNKKGMVNFDLAIETFTKLHGKLRNRNDEFACSVMKSHALALYGKMELAELTGNYDLSDEIAVTAQELMAKVEACSPGFATESITARLFAGSMDYIPVLPIDQTKYYENFRDQIQSARKLRGDERETEFNRLLKEIEGMAVHPKDPELFARMIAPERERIEEALAQGFDEEIDDDEFDIYDPNM